MSLSNMRNISQCSRSRHSYYYYRYCEFCSFCFTNSVFSVYHTMLCNSCFIRLYSYYFWSRFQEAMILVRYSNQKLLPVVSSLNRNYFYCHGLTTLCKSELVQTRIGECLDSSCIPLNIFIASTCLAYKAFLTKKSYMQSDSWQKRNGCIQHF